MIKRALAAALCLMLVFALLPKTARADTTTTETLYFSGGQLHIGSESGAVYDGEGTTWSGSGSTLTLTGFDFSTSAKHALVLPAGTTLVLNGINKVTSVPDSSDSSDAIFVRFGNLTIQGTGTLTATGGTCDFASTGINVGGDLIILGGSVTGKGGSSDDADSYGVSAGGRITVEGGTLTGEGGTGTKSSGVKADTIFVKGGSIKGTGGVASVANESSGFQCGTFAIGRNVEFRFEGKGYTALDAKGCDSQYSQVPYWRIEEDGGYTQSNRWQDYISNRNVPPYFDVRTALPTTPSIKVSVPAFGMMQAPENETVTVNSDDGINATDNFLSAQMDGQPIDLGTVNGTPGVHGSVRNGSIVIQLNQAYLNTLSAGTHTLRVNLTGVYAGKFVEAQITVQSSGDGTGGDFGAEDVPKTGDGATPVLWLGLMLLAGAGLAVSAVRRRKRQNG